MPRRVMEDKVFAGQLKFYREKAGLTKIRLASLLGISDQLYNRYENKNAQPDIELLNKIAKTLRVSVDDLLGFHTDSTLLDTALDILEIAGFQYRYHYQYIREGDRFDFSLPDGKHAEISRSQLTMCVIRAKNQADTHFRSSLDSLFSKVFQHVFWEAIGKKQFRAEVYNDIEAINLGDCKSTVFAERLRHFREKKKLTQAQLANYAGLKPQTYNRYEKKNANPSILLLKIFASALAISVNELIGGYDPSRRELALRYLQKVGIGYREETETIVVQRPIWDELFPDEQEVYLDSGNDNPTEDLALTENEVCFYVDYAWRTANKIVQDDMDGIVAESFRPLFFDLLQSPSTEDGNLPAEIPTTEMYLYRSNWSSKPGQHSLALRTDGQPKTISLDDPEYWYLTAPLDEEED